MPFRRVNRARMTVSAGGTGSITVGSADTKFQSFATAGIANTDTFGYLIEDGNDWELGIGTYTASGTTVARVLKSSSTGSLLNVTTNAKITIVPFDEDFEMLNTRGVSGTSDTLVITDMGCVVEAQNGSATTITVPPNSSVPFPIGAIINIEQYGAGQVTIAQGVGVTVRSAGSRLKIAERYGAAHLRKRGTDEWVLIGNTAA